MGQIDCPKTSVKNYQPTLLNIPEDQGPHLHFGGSLKSCMLVVWGSKYTVLLPLTLE